MVRGLCEIRQKVHGKAYKTFDDFALDLKEQQQFFYELDHIKYDKQLRLRTQIDKVDNEKCVFSDNHKIGIAREDGHRGVNVGGNGGKMCIVAGNL